MQTFKLNSKYATNYELFIEMGTYSNGRPAIQLMDAEDGCPYATATVNLPDVLLEDNEILVKDYSENEGILNFLVENNIVTPTEKGIESGHVWIPVAILNPQSEWGQLDPPAEQINPENGLKMWTIKDYRIWARSYKEALNLLPLIESF